MRILEAYLLLLLLLAQVHLFDIVLQAEFLQNNFDLPQADAVAVINRRAYVLNHVR